MLTPRFLVGCPAAALLSTRASAEKTDSARWTVWSPGFMRMKEVLLITAYAARESAFRPVLARLRVENPARYQGPGPGELAEVVFTRVFRAPADVPAPSGR